MLKTLLFSLIGLFLLSFPGQIYAITSDDDYVQLGEQIMDQMMGTNHKQADQNIKDSMGEDFLRQMHLAMGKIAEKNVSGNGAYGMMPMMSTMMGGGGFNIMGNYGGGMMGGGTFGVFAIIGWITWILIITALVLAIVWLWKQIQKK